MLSRAYSKYQHLVYTDFCQVGEHSVKMPSLPDNPQDIFFINDDYDNAYWDRERILKEQYEEIFFRLVPNETKLDRDETKFDDDGYAITLNEKDSAYIRFVYEREMKRRVHGVHIRNGNEITWITGDHWFVLMWCKTKRPDKKGDYFDYREYQRDFFYIINHCLISEFILGCFWSKAKKTGVTNLMWLYYLNKATMTKNINLGNMNIDTEKGAKTFRDHFLYAYNGLPLALRPEHKTKKENDGTIVFGKKYNNSKSKRNLDDDELNTTVTCVACALSAFDVDVFTDIWYDEPPKYKGDFGAIYRSNSGGTRIQDYIVGKIWATSYTPEQSGVSFTASKNLFYDSELKTITPNSNGKTKSMLICHHIPAYQSWATSFDKYGKCNEQDAKNKIDSERESLKDRPKEYLKKVREYANNKKEAWSVADSSALFNPIRLSELEFELEELQRSGQTFQQGELQWENPLWEVGKKDKRPKGEFGRVRAIYLSKDAVLNGEKGKMREYEPLQRSLQNASLLRGKDEWGNLLPPKRFNCVGGIDPADYRVPETDGEYSNIAMYSMIVHDELTNTQNGRVATKIINAEYFARPDNPEEWYQDIVKHIIYYGCLVIIESNNGTIATRLEDEGLGHYMLFKNDEGVLVRYRANHNKSLKLIKNVKSGGVDTIADIILYIKNYLLEANPKFGEIDYGATIKSERLLKQLKEFDPEDTKKFDLVMAFGYLLMCHENYLALLTIREDNRYQSTQINSVLRALERVF